MIDKVIHFDFNDTQLASLYEEVSMWSVHFGQLLLKHQSPAHNLNILDVGCGTGFPLFELAYLYGTTCTLTGLDVWKTALERAEQRKQYFGISHVNLVHLASDTYPFPDNHFDLITSNLGVNNFENPQQALSECARVLKPDGRLALTTNYKGHMAEFYDVFREVLQDFGNADYLDRLAQHEDHRGTIDTHRALLENTGFEIVGEDRDEFIWRFLDGTTLFNHPIIRFGFMSAWLAIVDEADRAKIFAELEQRLNAVAQQQGELRLTIPMLYLEGKERA